MATKTYYLSQDYHRNNSASSICLHKNAYITNTLSTAYSRYATDTALVFNLTFDQVQGVPYNFTVKYANGTAFNPGTAWYSIDYSNFDSNNYVLVTFDPHAAGAYYNISDLYELNFVVSWFSR